MKKWLLHGLRVFTVHLLLIVSLVSWPFSSSVGFKFSFLSFFFVVCSGLF